MENTNCKKTMGRRKIEIKKIEKKTNLQVTFTKRRRGLFRKASELAVLCGAEIAILVQSPAEKIFAFGHPSVAALINRAEAAEASLIPPFAAGGQQIVLRCDDGRRECEEAAMMLEMERRKAAEKEMNQMMMVMGGMFWWEEPHEGLELHELQEFLKALEILEENVSQKAEECAKSKMMTVSEFALSIQEFGASSSNHCALMADDDGGGDDYQDLFDLLNS